MRLSPTPLLALFAVAVVTGAAPSSSSPAGRGTWIRGDLWARALQARGAVRTSDAGPDVRGMPDGAVFEAYANGALAQTILFARFPDGREGSAAVTIHDEDGEPRVALAAALENGATMLVWDGRGSDGVPVPAGVYVAKLQSGADTLSAALVR